jgi:hypothetical protein
VATIERLEGPARRRWLTALLAGLLALSVVTLGVIVWQRHQKPTLTFCAGVGLEGAPVGPTQDAAFDLWLAGQHGESPRSAWHQEGDSWVNRRHGSGTHTRGYASVQVYPARDDTGKRVAGWTVGGACV